MGAGDAEGAGTELLLLPPLGGWALPWLKASAKLPETCVELSVSPPTAWATPSSDFTEVTLVALSDCWPGALRLPVAAAQLPVDVGEEHRLLLMRRRAAVVCNPTSRPRALEDPEPILRRC